MNWRLLELTPAMVGMRVLVKSGNRNGKESFFCGVIKSYNRTYAVKDQQGSFHYFRKSMKYYYINIDEVK